MTMAVYCIEFKMNNICKRYVGGSTNIEKRWISHRNKLNLNYHENRLLQVDWNKYGEKFFKFYIL